MVLDKLGESLSGVVRKITRASYVDAGLVKEVVRDIQRALLTSDVNVKLVMELSKKIETRALQEKPKPGLSRKEHVIHIVYEELVALVGRGDGFRLPTRARIMMIGLQGSGKTTSSVKLARFFSKKGLGTYLIACDTHRPAAYDQLVQLAEPLNIKVYGEPGTRDAVQVLKRGLEKAEKAEVVIVDTAGRHKSEEELFEEMKALSAVFGPDEKFLVIDANIGQQAGAQARAFNQAVGVTGVVLTKLDGSAKGGGALSAVAETGAPVTFVGLGEGMDDFEVFDPERFISRLLGMGDLAALMEKARETVDEEMAKDFMKGKFTMTELREQILALKKMGPLSSVMSMIPGLGVSVPKDVSAMTEEKMSRFLYIIDSMNKKEREDPKIINSSRIKRIARGSGSAPEEVRELLTYYKTMQKAIKGLKKGFGRRGGPRGMGQLARLMRGMK
ncbi:MAG: signal recognition particle protein [Euryarchaeota archaeon]|nr:signal recognition particle protein [Euryarchaeota archaeon]